MCSSTSKLSEKKIYFRFLDGAISALLSKENIILCVTYFKWIPDSQSSRSKNQSKKEVVVPSLLDGKMYV